MKWMLILSMIIFCGHAGRGQEMMATVPVNELLVVIVPQRDCSLVFEDAIGTKDRKGRAGIMYRILNRGTKSVKSYTIAIWYSDNGLGGVITTGVLPSIRGMFEPNTSVDNFSNAVGGGREKSKGAELPRTSNAKLIAFVTIAEIVYADGTKYSSPETFESLKTHVSKIESLYQDN